MMSKSVKEEVVNMKKIILVCMVFFVLILTACQNKEYDAISKDESFIASVNILQPSIDFFNKSGEKITSWVLEEMYTGAILVEADQLLLYGNQLDFVDLYSLSTGKLQKRIPVEKGSTAAYFNDKTSQFYITNGEYNTVTAYSNDGEIVSEAKVGLYPMSMVANEEKVYVINFKDTFLSVLNTKDLKLEKKIPIKKSSHGMDFIEDELWIGGHGAGEKPNSKVQRINPNTGELIGELELPIMPIAFTKLDGDEYVLSHGESILYQLNEDYKIVWQQEIGSNPFAVATFDQTIVVAGYDDQSLYWIKDKEILHKIKVGKGPFQLIVREGN